VVARLWGRLEDLPAQRNPIRPARRLLWAGVLLAAVSWFWCDWVL